MTDASPRHQFYGRRKGHALRRHHLQLMAELLPKLRFDGGMPAPPAWLEIGFGGGEHLAHQAALNPDVSFIGAEPFINGVAKLLALIEGQKLSNIRIHDGDARQLLERLPDGCFDRVYLLYPDPWPKLRQNKRRFVSTATVAQMHRVLKPGGLLLFASDIADYVNWTRSHVADHVGFAEAGDSAQPYENWIQTRYEAKARREGRGSNYLRFKKLDG